MSEGIVLTRETTTLCGKSLVDLFLWRDFPRERLDPTLRCQVYARLVREVVAAGGPDV
jgi:hypothetical protein